MALRPWQDDPQRSGDSASVSATTADENKLWQGNPQRGGDSAVQRRGGALREGLKGGAGYVAAHCVGGPPHGFAAPCHHAL